MSIDVGKEKYQMNQNQTVHPGTGRYQEQTKDGGGIQRKHCGGK
jgi:hypothetical protein